MKATEVVYFVYGTHGDNPSQIDDYIRMYGELAEACGLQFRLTFDPVAGEANILMECFNDEWTARLLDLKRKNPKTRYLIVCTEYLTGNTFNYFPKVNAKVAAVTGGSESIIGATTPASLSISRKSFGQQVYSTMRTVLPSSVIGVIGAFPGLKKIVHRKFGVKGDGWASPYFEKRFKNFTKVAEVSSRIAVVGFDQMAAYVDRFGSGMVGIVPSVPYLAPQFSRLIRDDRKDIDFLFSGTLTAYRKEALNRLRSLGYRVESGFWGPSVRQHFIDRAKICLHIRQYGTWVSPSVMRIHQLLCSGALVVCESTSPQILQDQFVKMVDPEGFIDECVDSLKQGEFTERGQKNALDYYNHCESLRANAEVLILGFVKP